jgi:ElaB/YqjD/DUF883 family membrane-anchored ribosome-binding protein
MSEDIDAAVEGSAAKGVSPAAKSALSGAASFVPQSALDAADAKIASWSGLVIDAADTIERLIGSESLPVPDAARELAKNTTQKLRSLGTAASEQQAADLVAGLQKTAAAHPAASIGVGAAVGAALAALLVRLSASEASERSHNNRDVRPQSKGSQAGR